MKAVVVNNPGSPENLIYQNVAKPKVIPGWSLIKIKGFGINHSEIFTREGKSPSVNFPRILGIECVGVIDETTDQHRLPIQQKVISIMGEMGRAFDGSYAEYVLVPNEQIYPITTELTWNELATIPETYYTAYGSMLNLNITESDRLLVRGATSGVGIAFVNLIKSKYPSIQVTGTTRHLNKSESLKNVGFDNIIEEKNGLIQGKNSFDKILELVGPATIKDSFNHLNEGGIVCSTGQLGGQWYLDNFDPIMDIHQNSYLTSFYSNNVDENKLNNLLNYITDYKVNVNPEKIFNLRDISEAHRYLQGSQSFGKVIVRIND